jgi:alpha-tubulin suppressor-like RCC1 family protein
LALGGSSSCALALDRSVWCWGALSEFEFANPVPRRLPGFTDAVRVLGGSGEVCAIVSDGSLWCRGDNDHGQLGDGTRQRRVDPVRVQGLGGVVQADIAAKHGCAVISDHRVFCWGANELGQLGNGTTSDSLTPVEVEVVLIRFGGQVVVVVSGVS